MGDGVIHDQSTRRRETVSLRLRFLNDYVVFDFQIASFLDRHRCGVMKDEEANLEEIEVSHTLGG